MSMFVQSLKIEGDSGFQLLLVYCDYGVQFTAFHGDVVQDVDTQLSGGWLWDVVVYIHRLYEVIFEAFRISVHVENGGVHAFGVIQIKDKIAQRMGNHLALIELQTMQDVGMVHYHQIGAIVDGAVAYLAIPLVRHVTAISIVFILSVADIGVAFAIIFAGAGGILAAGMHLDYL